MYSMVCVSRMVGRNYWNSAWTCTSRFLPAHLCLMAVSSRRHAADRIEREAQRRRDLQVEMPCVLAGGIPRPGIVPGTVDVRPQGPTPYSEPPRAREAWSIGAVPGLGHTRVETPRMNIVAAPSLPTPRAQPATKPHPAMQQLALEKARIAARLSAAGEAVTLAAAATSDSTRPPAPACTFLPAPPLAPPSDPPPPPPATMPAQTPEQPVCDVLCGAGAFAKVRVATRPDGQKLAIKAYDERQAAQYPPMRAHLHNELKLVGVLDHPHVAAPRLARRSNWTTEIEMEYVSGGTLEQLLKKTREARPSSVRALAAGGMWAGLPEDEAKRLFAQLADATDYLHRNQVCATPGFAARSPPGVRYPPLTARHPPHCTNQVCHRDIKPDNVMLDERGDVRLIDFGAAHQGALTGESIAGTPAFMAPEVRPSLAVPS